MDHDGVWAIDAAPPPPLGRMMQPGTGTDTRRKKIKNKKLVYVHQLMYATTQPRLLISM